MIEENEFWHRHLMQCWCGMVSRVLKNDWKIGILEKSKFVENEAKEKTDKFSKRAQWKSRNKSRAKQKIGQ
jgi:hypothetical protein